MRAVRSLAVDLGAAALDLVVPQACAGCGDAGLPWCPGCRAAVDGATHPVPGAVPCRAAAPHAGPAGRAVVAFKDGAVRSLAGPLSRLLARAIRDVLIDAPIVPAQPVWLVPVPGRRAARRRRGADPVPLLAARAARSLRRDGVAAHRCPALVHVRDSRDQVGLSGRQRRDNVAGTLAGLSVPPGTIVVVDDVTTTGATIAEAVRALRAVGGRGAAGDGRTILAATVTWAGPVAAPRVGLTRGLAL